MPTRIKMKDAKLQQILKAAKGQKSRRYTIHDGVEYGVFQEFTDRGHPSLVPAFERVTKQLPEAIGQAIEAGVPVDDVIKKAAFDVQALWAADVSVDTGAYKNSITVSEE